jgi:hypothetical protein
MPPRTRIALPPAEHSPGSRAPAGRKARTILAGNDAGEKLAGGRANLFWELRHSKAAAMLSPVGKIGRRVREILTRYVRRNTEGRRNKKCT